MGNFHLRDDFRAGAPVSQVPASWFNAVARFLNNLVGGYGIRIVKSLGSPTIELDPTYLQDRSSATCQEFAAPDATDETQNAVPPRHLDNGAVVLQSDAWTRGDTDGSGDGAREKGVKVYLPTDCFDDGAYHYMCWRLCEFGADGRLKSIGAETVKTLSLSPAQL